MSSLDCPVVVIDGSFASHLSTLVKDPVDGDPLWSASFLVKAPNAVIKVHYDYLTGKNEANCNGQHCCCSRHRQADLKLFIIPKYRRSMFTDIKI